MKTLLWISLILPLTLLACSSPEPINYGQEFEFEFLTSETNTLELHLAKGEVFYGRFNAWTVPEVPPPPASIVRLMDGVKLDNVSIRPTFSWLHYGVLQYRLIIATDSRFTNIVYETTVWESPLTDAVNLQYNTAYFWRFIVANVDPTDDWGQVIYESPLSTTVLHGMFFTQEKPSPPPAHESAELIFYAMNYWQQTILDAGRVQGYAFEIEASESSVYYLVFNSADVLKVSLIYNSPAPLRKSSISFTR